MKLATTSLALLLSGLAALSVADDTQLATLDRWYGFRDARFDSERSQIAGYWHFVGNYSEDPSVQVYERRPEKTAFAGVPLDSIHYIFVGDRLARVALHVNGKSDARRLNEALEDQFGAATGGTLGGVTWTGNQVQLLFVCLDEFRECEKAAAVFSHERMWEQWVRSREVPNKPLQPTPQNGAAERHR
jgi:hypothetical protein